MIDFEHILLVKDCWSNLWQLEATKSVGFLQKNFGHAA